MGRLKLADSEKRKVRQYYLTDAERVQMDALFNKIRNKGGKAC